MVSRIWIHRGWQRVQQRTGRPGVRGPTNQRDTSAWSACCHMPELTLSYESRSTLLMAGACSAGSACARTLRRACPAYGRTRHTACKQVGCANLLLLLLLHVTILIVLSLIWQDAHPVWNGQSSSKNSREFYVTDSTHLCMPGGTEQLGLLVTAESTAARPTSALLANCHAGCCDLGCVVNE
jgi:hypothetical protein